MAYSSTSTGSYAVPTAGTFALLYFLAFAWYFQRSARSLVHRTQIAYAITIFCLLRVVSFTIRVVLSARRFPSTDADAPLLAAQEVLIHAGFLFLLYPAYILILKLEKFTLATSHVPSPLLLLNPIRLRPFFRLALLISAILRIMATPQIHSNSDHDWAPETIRALDQTSSGIFMVLAGVVVLLAVDLVRINWAHTEDPSIPTLVSTPAATSSSQLLPEPKNNLFHTSLIVLLISLLLLLRQIFATTSLYPSTPTTPWHPPQKPLLSPTQKSTLITNGVSEFRWYIFLAVPELVAVALFSRKGLEPPHTIVHYDRDRDRRASTEPTSRIGEREPEEDSVLV